MKTIPMRFWFLPLLWISFTISAQNTPAEIHYSVMDLLALRYYPFTQSADSIVKKVVEKNKNRNLSEVPIVDKKTSFDGMEEIYRLFGNQNTNCLIDEIFSPVDLFDENTDFLFSFVQGPLTQEGLKKYKFYFSTERTMRDLPVYEIVFFPKNSDEKGFAGYLYVAADGTYSLIRTFFTLYHPSDSMQDVLLTQIFETKDEQDLPLRSKTTFSMGSPIGGSFLLNQTFAYTDQPLPADFTDFIDNPSFSSEILRKNEKLIHILLTDHLTIGGEKGLIEWGPVSETVSYNEIEGLRLKASGNTTLQLNPRWLLGGSLAYGTKDQQFKYRGDVIYSFLPKDRVIWEFPKRQIGFSYAKDLNIPGQDLLNSSRDNIFSSFLQSRNYLMTLQNIAYLYYEQEFTNRFSFKIGGKYRHEQSIGNLHYPNITNSEVNLSLRYAPGEVFLQNRHKRIYFRQGIVELNLNHRIGIKGVFGSKFAYHATDFKAHKKIPLPATIGSVNLQLSIGKMWSRVPFPLLFIPVGNQSYIFDMDNYNLMNFYEFTTDRFIAGNINFLFNWSPFRLFSESSIKTSCGIRSIYGPLSDNNNPALHPKLIHFNERIHPLGNTPYTEINVGLANIFQLLRIEWVHRLTPGNNKGSFFTTAYFNF